MSSQLSPGGISSPLAYINVEGFVTKVCPRCREPASSHAILCSECSVPLDTSVDKEGFEKTLRYGLFRAMQDSLAINTRGLFDRIFNTDGSIIQYVISASCINLLDTSMKVDIPRLTRGIADLERSPSTGDIVRKVDLIGVLKRFRDDLTRTLKNLRDSAPLNPLETEMTVYQKHYNDFRRTEYEITKKAKAGDIPSEDARKLQQIENDLQRSLNAINDTNNHLGGQEELRKEFLAFQDQLKHVPAGKMTPDLYIAAAEWTALMQVMRNMLNFTKKFGSFTQTKKKGG